MLLTWPHLQVPRLIPGMAVAGFGQGLESITMFRVALSRVPADRAGAGSGVLVTTEHVSVAAGVATSEILFLCPPIHRSSGIARVRPGHGIQVLVAVAIAVPGQRLPDPRVPAAGDAR